MGVAAAGQTPLPYAKAISAWFDRRLGLALGIAMAGVGIGAAVVPQIAQALIGWSGWRAAYVGLGLLTFALAFPAVAFLVRQPAGWRDAARAAAAAGGAQSALPGLTGREALRSGHFWTLAVVFFIAAAACNGTIAHIVPLLTDRGVTPAAAASALSAAGLALVGGRLVAGYLLDRIYAPYVAVVFLLLPVAGITLLLLTADPALAWSAALLIGLGLGAEIDLVAFFIRRYLGMRSFGEIYGYLFAIFMFGSGIGPFALGVTFDRAGSYLPLLAVLAAALLVACVLILRIGDYVYPATDHGGTARLRPAAGV
jgi:cyanate permease